MKYNKLERRTGRVERRIINTIIRVLKLEIRLPDAGNLATAFHLAMNFKQGDSAFIRFCDMFREIDCLRKIYPSGEFSDKIRDFLSVAYESADAKDKTEYKDRRKTKWGNN